MNIRAACYLVLVLLGNAMLIANAAADQRGGLCGNASPNLGEECDDGNSVDGDGCSASCLIEPAYDCTPAVPGTPDVNLVTDGSFENGNLNGDWTTLEHSLFPGGILCDDGCFGVCFAADEQGGCDSGGAYVLAAGGTFSEPSTGVVEHGPIIIPPQATTLTFAWATLASGPPGDACAGPNDGITVSIDGQHVWSNLDAGVTCTNVNPYDIISIDLASLGVNDGLAHTIRFDAAATGIPPSVNLTNVFLDQVRIMVTPDDALPPVPSQCTLIVCGDGLLGSTEQCDDGNTTPGDGCSETCLIEQPNFVCADPLPPAAQGEVIADGGLESGRAGSSWIATATLFDPICSQALCGPNLANSGAFYAWFGRATQANVQTLAQDVVIPTTSTTLDFQLLMETCGSIDDALTVDIDGTEVFRQDCVADVPVYTPVAADISAFADGAAHTVTFTGSIVAPNGLTSNFVVDDISISTNVPFAGAPGVCEELAPACGVVEQFESGLPASWTVINRSAISTDGWGTSNDGLCAGFNWSTADAQNNVTGGGGVAACADSDATGQVDVDNGGTAQPMDTYLCSPALNPSVVTDPVFTFAVNYQSAGNALNDNGTPGDTSDDFDDDVLMVVGGTSPPNALTTEFYTPIANVIDHLDTTLALSGPTTVRLPLSDFNAASEFYVCFHYTGTYDWFAQIDNVALRGSDCDVVIEDPDFDGVPGDVDNCYDRANPTQLDSDDDGYGNACDADFNNDCVVNITDLGIFRTRFFVAGGLTDLNGDGSTNVIDLGLLRTMFFLPPGPSALGHCTP